MSLERPIVLKQLTSHWSGVSVLGQICNVPVESLVKTCRFPAMAQSVEHTYAIWTGNGILTRLHVTYY